MPDFQSIRSFVGLQAFAHSAILAYECGYSEDMMQQELDGLGPQQVSNPPSPLSLSVFPAQMAHESFHVFNFPLMSSSCFSNHAVCVCGGGGGGDPPGKPQPFLGRRPPGQLPAFLAPVEPSAPSLLMKRKPKGEDEFLRQDFWLLGGWGVVSSLAQQWQSCLCSAQNAVATRIAVWRGQRGDV